MDKIGEEVTLRMFAFLIIFLLMDCRGRLRLPRNDAVLVIAKTSSRHCKGLPLVIARNAVTKQSTHYAMGRFSRVDMGRA